jgi:hypothetical protein
MPIPRAVFERYFLVIARTYAEMFTNNLTTFGAPGVAFLLLRETAKQMGRWEGNDGIEQGLMPEIFRLANVVMPGPNGWTAIPFDEARTRKLIDDDDLAEVENRLVFFTLASVMPPKKDRPTILGFASNVWSAQIMSLNCTEFAASLPTSKEIGNSGAEQTKTDQPVSTGTIRGPDGVERTFLPVY